MGSPSSHSQMSEEGEKHDSDVRQLYVNTLLGKWREVVKLYETKPEVWSAEITSSGDTALHLIIDEDKEDVLEKLLEIILKADDGHHLRKVEALTKANEVGDTPLHRAAAIGSVKMCKSIVMAATELRLDGLLQVRNIWGENPIFMAVLDNRKHAFIYLLVDSDIVEDKVLISPLNGDTVLHCAILREHYGIRVDPLEYDDSVPTRTVPTRSSNLEYPPDNYQTCYQFLSILRRGGT
ncbi:NF-kappa-B inhibitor alpha-like [Neltuma alba]|uniref:NF-kappa-B inhibitor alpha-like n=1 Tax=Neltuma alba TaxID=207710 RepID=UPI0010A33F5F|nr:NF-kappa-B inhibitor alpha-like [Prosopis alba]